MSPTPEQFEPDMKNVRVYYEVGGEENHTLYKDIDAVIKQDEWLKVVFGKDKDGDRQRFMCYPSERVISWKIINVNGGLAQE